MKSHKRQFIEKYVSINTIDAHVEVLEQELLEAIEKDESPKSPVWPGEEEIEDAFSKCMKSYNGYFTTRDSWIEAIQWLKERAGGGEPHTAGRLESHFIENSRRLAKEATDLIRSKEEDYIDEDTGLYVGKLKYPSTAGGEKDSLSGNSKTHFPEPHDGSHWHEKPQPSGGEKEEVKGMREILNLWLQKHGRDLRFLDSDLWHKTMDVLDNPNPQPPTSGKGEEIDYREELKVAIGELFKTQNENQRLKIAEDNLGLALETITRLQSENNSLKAEIAKLKSGEQFSREDMKGFSEWVEWEGWTKLSRTEPGYYVWCKHLKGVLIKKDTSELITNYLTEVKQKK